MSNMKDQIAKTIQENLPSAVMQEYQSYIENAERNARDLAEAKRKIEGYKEHCEKLETKILILEKLENDAVAIRKKEKEVAEQEQRLALTLAEMKLAEAEKRIAEIKDLASIAFRNPRLKHIENGSVPFLHMQNGYPQTYTGCSSKTIETTEE